MPKKQTRRDRIKLSPATVHPDTHRALLEIKNERSCPMGMAIDELYWRMKRALDELAEARKHEQVAA